MGNGLRIVVVGLLLLSVSTTVAAPRERADPLVAAIEDVLAARAAGARHVLAASGALHYGRPRTRVAGGDWVVDPLALRSVACTYVLRQGSEARQSTWAVDVEVGRWITRMLTFEAFNVDRAESTSISTMLPGNPSAHMWVSPPSAEVPGWPMQLGLSLASGDTILSLLPDPVVLSEANLRGQRCKLLASGPFRLWLAPELGYAPLRLVQGAPGPDRSVSDWFDYRAHGALSLPRYKLARSIYGGAVDQMSITKHQLLAVGEKAVAAEAPVGWDVPVVPGATAKGRGGATLKAGLSPDDLHQLAQLDGKPWGLSIAKLAADETCEGPLPQATPFDEAR